MGRHGVAFRGADRIGGVAQVDRPAGEGTGIRQRCAESIRGLPNTATALILSANGADSGERSRYRRSPAERPHVGQHVDDGRALRVATEYELACPGTGRRRWRSARRHPRRLRRRQGNRSPPGSSLRTHPRCSRSVAARAPRRRPAPRHPALPAHRCRGRRSPRRPGTFRDRRRRAEQGSPAAMAAAATRTHRRGSTFGSASPRTVAGHRSRGDVHGVGRLPGPAPGVFDEVARVLRPGAPFVHVLQPVFPDQGDPGLAGHRRRVPRAAGG